MLNNRTITICYFRLLNYSRASQKAVEPELPQRLMTEGYFPGLTGAINCHSELILSYV